MPFFIICTNRGDYMDKPNRFYSKKQESSIANELGLKRTPNSGATLFQKGDVTGERILLEAKTVTKPQKSITLHKEWITKNQEEAFSRGKELPVLAFDFGDGERFYVLSEQDFKNMYQLWEVEQ